MYLTEPAQRVCVYGAGAVGGSLAVRLAGSGAQVTVVARGPHGDAIARDGLTLICGEQRLHARPACTADAASVRGQDVVVVAVKSNALAQLAPRLAAMVRPGGLLVFAMNGLPWWFFDTARLRHLMTAGIQSLLDPGGVLATHIPRQQAIGCVVASSNEVVAPGVVLNTTPQGNRLVLGAANETLSPACTGALDTLAALLANSGYGTTLTHDIRGAIWSKMLLAVGASPVAALTGRNLQELVTDGAAHALISAAMDEGLALGRCLGFTLPDDVGQRLATYQKNPVRPSLLQDLERGQPLEIANGLLAFAELARELGRAAPHLQTLATLMRLRAATPQPLTTPS